MNAIIAINLHESGESNGGASGITLCVDGKVHLEICDSWMDYGDCTEARHVAKASCCDCKPPQEVKLHERHARLVEEFLATGKDQEIRFDQKTSFDQEIIFDCDTEGIPESIASWHYPKQPAQQ